MKSDDWNIIKTLYATKNLTKASQLLYISQPALSKRIRHIEEVFDCSLIYRSNKGISFTPEGEYLAAQSRKFLALTDETFQHLHGMGITRNNTIRLEAPTTFAKYYLVEILAEFRKAHPDISVNVRVNVSSDIPESVSNHVSDCGFLLGHAEHKLSSILYDTQQCYAVYNRALKLEDLPNLPLILHNRNQVTQQAVFQWWKQHFPMDPNIAITVLDLDTALDMVAQGFGYSIAFGSFLKKRSDFCLLPLYWDDNRPFVRNSYLIYNDSALSNPSTKQFIDYINQRIRKCY